MTPTSTANRVVYRSFAPDERPMTQEEVAMYIGYRHTQSATNVLIAKEIGMSDARVSELRLYDHPRLSWASKALITSKLMAKYPDGIPLLTGVKTVAKNAKEASAKAFGPRQGDPNRPLLTEGLGPDEAPRSVEAEPDELEKLKMRLKEVQDMLHTRTAEALDLRDELKEAGVTIDMQADEIATLRAFKASVQTVIQGAKALLAYGGWE